jgi:hypothetical protein
MFALKALERADTLDGLAKPPEREETKRVPLFNLPEGCPVAIKVDCPSPEQPRVMDGEVSVDLASGSHGRGWTHYRLAGCWLPICYGLASRPR